MNPLNDTPTAPQDQDQLRGEAIDSLSDDKPIELPADDQFGLSPFAEALADSIIKNKNLEGTVMAINGPWGSGKSSTINLVRHYLKKKIKSNQSQNSFEFPSSAPNWLKSLPKRHYRKLSSDTNDSFNMPLEIVNFKCWWFRGEEALVTEFFHQLYRALDKSDLQVAKQAVFRLVSIMLRYSPHLAGAATNNFAPGLEKIIPAVTNYLHNITKGEKTVETLHCEISKDLSNSQKRYLMIIDDIDRLSEDEALLIFRLIKSVGRLPKITYLLAYDREVAEKIVSKRYPSEGPRYLEKIVQAPFDIPYPRYPDLRTFFLKSLSKLLNKSYDQQPFENIFDTVLKYEIQSPRDSIRIINVLNVTWPAVAGEVYPADFLALETLRVQKPDFYAILKGNKHLLTKRPANNDNNKTLFQNTFLNQFPNEKHEKIKNTLMILFPMLRVIWEDTCNSEAAYNRDDEKWGSKRRACSPDHFDTYFRFSLSPEVVEIEVINSIIDQSGNESDVKEAIIKENSQNNLEQLLHELRLHAQEIPLENTQSFLNGLFKAYDIINTDESDMDLANKFISLLPNLPLSRSDLEQRSDIIYNCVVHRSFNLFACLALKDYNTFSLINESHMENLRQKVFDKIEENNNNLLYNGDYLISILHILKVLNYESRSDWFKNKLNNDDTVIEIVKGFLKLFRNDRRGDFNLLLTEYLESESPGLLYIHAKKINDINHDNHLEEFIRLIVGQHTRIDN